jgi:hypothetical protein
MPVGAHATDLAVQQYAMLYIHITVPRFDRATLQQGH